MKLPPFIAFLVARIFSHAADHPPVVVTMPPVRPATSQVNLARLAAAIETVENTANHRIGAAGERSRFQITGAVWRQHSNWPFEYASSNRLVCRAEATRVMMSHLDFLRRQLERHGRHRTAYYLALAYGAGLEAVLHGRTSRRKCEYAQRVVNVYESGT